ncbi:hypothetical protein EKM05_13220 [Flavobacterium sp. GSP27]|uniref:NHL repeat-containing protein n=1 Tax=Flavobacterium sp. GSP27 TaxID=2497489 RepID=UPI000F848812|nr:NHL repeat-containing protein [Flavobacterium sp. GSP27]RTZ05909.1 hypothetical protein EKM05_13220 [Flavobacterium sp. GSP27]
MKKTLLLLLFLLAAMQPNLFAQKVTLTTSKTTIAENESASLTATLDVPTDKDVTISLASTGTAILSPDFITNSAVVITTAAGGNGSGSNANQLSSPNSFFVDNAGNIYVTDTQNNRIQKWAPGAISGTTVAGGNGMGANANQLSSPNNLFVDTAGNIYIADTQNYRIQKWAPGAITGTTVAGGNGMGSNANQLSYPNRFFVDTIGNIYVVDGMNNRIQKWEAGAITGTTVAGGNGTGSGANQLSSPNSFFVDNAGNIYVTDTQNNRIQKWAPGAISGTTVAGGNGMGSNANQLSYPNNLFVDTAENIYIADSQNNRIQKWALGATTGITVAGGNGMGSNANQLSYPNNLFVDTAENIYIADSQNNRIQKWALGATTGTTVAGGNGAGANANQLSSPNSFFIDTTANIYVADGMNNRIQKYQYSPQIIIKAGQTTAQLIVSGIVDSADEYDETIVLEPGITNATLASTDPIRITLTDNNTPPTVTFTFSKDKITENSQTDVTLTATLSNISGKDIDIDFLIQGTATETGEYTVNSKRISIPANKPSGNTSISTKGLDDTLVEMLESIIFKISTITNATATIDTATLYLESDDNPKVTVTVSPTTIAEHESATITATLDAASSKDVTISLESNGTAVYDQDFKTNSAVVISKVAGGNGAGSNANQLNYPSKMSVDAGGNVYIANSNKIQKWAPGANEGTTVLTIASGTYVDFIIVDGNGNIYILDRMQSRIEKWVPGATSGVTVSGGNGSGSNANQFNSPSNFFVDAIGNIYVTDTNNNRIQKWTPGATTGITVAGGNGNGATANQLNNPRATFVDAAGNIYVNDNMNNRIQKWTPGSLTGVTVLGAGPVAEYVYLGQNIEGLFVNSTEKIFLMSSEYTNTGEVKYIKKWNPVTRKSEVLAGSNGIGSENNQLKNPQGFTLDSKGNLYIADTENNRIQKYQYSPQIIIKAGQTSAQLIVSGIEDELENEGTELIVLKTAAVNATLSSTDDIKVNLLDNTRTLTLQVNSPFTGLENGAVAWGL